MAPKTSSTGKDYKSSAKGQLKTSKIASSQPSRALGRYSEAKWHMTDYKPQRKISDQELAAARQIFFALDVDASGSIDADELGVMLRSLGQNPTEQELKDLIDEVDEGDKDGKIQLREFLKLYTQGLDNKNKGSRDDVDDVFRAVVDFKTGDAETVTTERKESIPKEDLVALLKGEFELDIDGHVEEVLGLLNNPKASEISKDEMGEFLVQIPTTAAKAATI